MRPSHAKSVRHTDPASEIRSAVSPTTRRSNMSATAPATVDKSATGSISAVCTNATLSADAVICVIAQAAPTPMMRSPKFDSRLAVQIRRKTPCRSGARAPLALTFFPAAATAIAVLASTALVCPSRGRISHDRLDERATPFAFSVLAGWNAMRQCSSQYGPSRASPRGRCSGH
jgi:hypothetical protein